MSFAFWQGWIRCTLVRQETPRDRRQWRVQRSGAISTEISREAAKRCLGVVVSGTAGVVTAKREAAASYIFGRKKKETTEPEDAALKPEWIRSEKRDRKQQHLRYPRWWSTGRTTSGVDRKVGCHHRQASPALNWIGQPTTGSPGTCCSWLVYEAKEPWTDQTWP